MAADKWIRGTLSSIKGKNKIILFLIISFSFILRIQNLRLEGLWYDELQSVTFAVLPLKDLVHSVLSYDCHPPLYYMQLHIWMTAGTSDLWLLLNSMLFSLLTNFSIYITARKIFGEREAIIASILFAVSPYSIGYAQEVRMYSLLMLLGVWCWFFNHQFLMRRASILNGIGIFTTSIAFLYSHGSGFMLFVSIYVYLGSIFILKSIKKSIVIKWSGLQALILIFYFPWLFRIYKLKGWIGNEHLPDLNSVLNTLWTLLYGFGPVPDPILKILAVALIVGLLIISIIGFKDGASLIISFIFGPIIACIIISQLIHPMWYHKPLAYIVPFFSISLALLSSSNESGPKIGVFLRHRSVQCMISIFLAGVFLVATFFQDTKSAHFYTPKATALYTKTWALPGDVFFITRMRFFWGFCWYFLGPGSVNPVGENRKLCQADGIKVVLTEGEIKKYLRPKKQYWEIICSGKPVILMRDIDGPRPF